MSPAPGDVLLTFSEIAVAFAGFSSIVAIFQRRADAWDDFDRFRFWVMLEHSLAALFFALLPFPLHFAGLGDAAVWSACGVALIVFCVVHSVYTRILARRGHRAVVSSLTTGLTAVASTVYLAIVVSQALNVLLLGGRFGVYLVGVFLVLFGSGVNFVRLLWVSDRSRDR